MSGILNIAEIVYKDVMHVHLCRLNINKFNCSK